NATAASPASPTSCGRSSRGSAERRPLRLFRRQASAAHKPGAPAPGSRRWGSGPVYFSRAAVVIGTHAVSGEAACLDVPRLAPQQGNVARRELKLPITAKQAHAQPDPAQLPRQRRAAEQAQSMDFLFAAIQLPDLAKARDPAGQLPAAPVLL